MARRRPSASLRPIPVLLCKGDQAILEYVGITDPLYMAVPAAVFEGILGEEIGRQAIRKAQIRVIVFDAEQEEIVRWMP